MSAKVAAAIAKREAARTKARSPKKAAKAAKSETAETPDAPAE